MKEFKDRVAVITGAASGIGRGLAERCVREGMKVVISDIEKDALKRTEKDLADLSGSDADVIGVVTDVSKVDEVKDLAGRATDAFGNVHLLFNNAGVAGGSGVLDSTLNDWKWIIDVNLWGVIHCIRTFVPLMLKQNEECHIVNTSSVSGLTTYHPVAPYHLTKHAIIALSELLYHELAMSSAKINVSVLCPGPVNTSIMDAERNRPEIYLNDQVVRAPDSRAAAEEEIFRQMIKAGMSPEEVADHVFDALKSNRFYILTHPEMKPLAELRFKSILGEKNPVLPPKPE